MNSSSGAATQICAHQFDRRFFSLPTAAQQRLQARLDQLGRTLRTFPHYRMQGADTFRLRVGDFRIIYQFNVDRNELILLAVGNRREIYKTSFN